MMYSIVWMCIYNYNHIDIYDVICLIEILPLHPFQPSAAPAVGGINPIQAWRLLRFGSVSKPIVPLLFTSK